MALQHPAGRHNSHELPPLLCAALPGAAAGQCFLHFLLKDQQKPPNEPSRRVSAGLGDSGIASDRWVFGPPSSCFSWGPSAAAQKDLSGEGGESLAAPSGHRQLSKRLDATRCAAVTCLRNTPVAPEQRQEPSQGRKGRASAPGRRADGKHLQLPHNRTELKGLQEAENWTECGFLQREKRSLLSSPCGEAAAASQAGDAALPLPASCLSSSCKSRCCQVPRCQLGPYFQPLSKTQSLRQAPGNRVLEAAGLIQNERKTNAQTPKGLTTGGGGRTWQNHRPVLSQR